MVIFQRLELSKSKKGYHEYAYLAELQSHNKEFDFLKSIDIEEKINCIEWLPREGNRMMMLTANDKSIKLWKVSEKTVKVVDSGKEKQLSLPKLKLVDIGFAPTLKREYSKLHNYHIHSVSLSSNRDNFISADDLAINLWNLENKNEAFQVINRKQPKGSEINEVITSAKFNFNSDLILGYSTSKGKILICDLRMGNRCEKTKAVIIDQERDVKKNFFSSFLIGVSDFEFSADGRYIFSRNYLSSQQWDLANPSTPASSIYLNEPIKAKLYQLYENESIFDRFELKLAPNGHTTVTGFYDRKFHTINHDSTHNFEYELNHKRKTMRRKIPNGFSDPIAEGYSYDDKILKLDVNNENSTVAVCKDNCLFIYNGSF